MRALESQRSRAQESRAAIERLYIAMRHLIIRGSYKPLGVSGESMKESLMTLQPEIYGAISDPERVELDGLLYVFERLPMGIEECRYIKLVSKEGFEESHFKPIIPIKRKRNCYRIDEEQMFIEMTRGRSDIYDILTHLTFMYIESEKIRRNTTDSKGQLRREWYLLEQIIEKEAKEEPFDKQVAFTYLSTILGRTFNETIFAFNKFEESNWTNSLFKLAYWLGKRSIEEFRDGKAREISFSSSLREKIGHHIHGELWARNIKSFLISKNWFNRPMHIISSNLHSVMNSFFAFPALRKIYVTASLEEMATQISLPKNKRWRDMIKAYALKHGMYQLDDTSGTNVSVQIFDLPSINHSQFPSIIEIDASYLEKEKPLLLVMDYAFGEQAYEIMDEFLKPFEEYKSKKLPLNVASISIMGKAGTLSGNKGDIMIPFCHIFEGTADNYPFQNELSIEEFQDYGLKVYYGSMITVLGTSLQNRDILRYFSQSSWKAIGLEMEGAHYQKAIQVASKIRGSVNPDVSLRYAYYASDNPLITGRTLASGPLGTEGVKPTYLITLKFLNKILNPKPLLRNENEQMENYKE